TAGTRPRVRARTCPTNRVNSATPASLRVPWPTRSKGGPVLIYLPPSRDVVPEARQKAGRLVVPEARQVAAGGGGAPPPRVPGAGKPRRGAMWRSARRLRRLLLIQFLQAGRRRAGR